MAQTQFATAYLQLVNMSTTAPLVSYCNSDEYSKIESLGPSLPKFSAPLPSLASAHTTQTTDASFKSIKPPFKFSVQLQVLSTDSIYKVKTDLIKHVSDLGQAGVTPGHIKLMVKGKVLQDTATIGEEAVSFMVMVSKPEKKEDVEMEDPEPSAPANDISEQAWADIYAVLERHTSDPAAVLAKLKRGYV